MSSAWKLVIALLVVSIVGPTLGQSDTTTSMPETGGTTPPKFEPSTEGFILSSFRFTGVDEYQQFTAITKTVSEIANTSLSGPGFSLNDPDLAPLSCDTDYARGELYYYDYNSRQLGLVENFDLTMDLSKMNVSVFQGSVGEDYIFVAVDWVSHNVYWVDGMLGEIFMKKGGKSDDNTAYKTVVSNLGRPRGLAVDPLAGYIFWTDLKWGTINRASLVGKEHMVLVPPGRQRAPSSIALDTTAQMVYWTDSYHINSIGYDGGSAVQKSLTRYQPAFFYSIIWYKGTLIVNDINNWYTHFIDPLTGDDVVSKEGSDKEAHYGLCPFVEKPMPEAVAPDLCDTYGCSHICVIEPKSSDPTCLCHDGYKLSDKKTCVEDAYPYHRGIVLNTGTKLCIANINILSDHKDETPTCFYTAPAGKTISWFDLDMKQRLVYLSMGESIYSVKIDQMNPTATEILQQNHNISGMSYDWVDGVLYYSLKTGDSATESIWKVDPATKTTIPTIPVYGEMVRALAVSPHDRKLFWISGIVDDTDEIKYTDLAMESGDITVLETTYDVDDVTRIYHHIDTETLYMLDESSWGKYLVQMEYDGNYTDFPTGVDDDLHDFAVYESYVLMAIHADGDEDTTLRSSDLRYTPLVTISSGKFIGLGKIMGIKVLDLNLLQKSYPNPCGKTVGVDNGGCEQICLQDVQGEKATCYCKIGFDLFNKTNCTSDPLDDNFIILTDVTYDSAFQIPIGEGANMSRVIGLKTPKLSSPTGIAYDYTKGTVVMTNDDLADIVSVYLNGSLDFRIMELMFNFPDRFAIDPHSKLIFYSAVSWIADWFYDSYIAVLNSKGEAKIIFEGAHYPRSIAIHPRKGWLFFTDHGDFSGIYRIDMDGGGYMEMVTDSITDIRKPNGLAIDYDGNRLFWADGHYDTIKSIDLNTMAIQQIHEDKGSNPMGLKYVNGHVYYSAWNNIQIKSFLVADTSVPKKITNYGPTHSLGGIADIDVYMSAYVSAEKVPENLGCSVNNGGCSDFCLPNSTGHSCGCVYGTELLEDGRTCDNVPRCKSKLLTATVNESNTCLLIEGDVCPFTCVPNYRPKRGVTTVTCTSMADPDIEDELLWDNDDPCEEIFCPKDISNVELNMTTCDRKVGSDCGDYTCMTGYERNEAVTSLVCQVSGQWEMSGPLCIAKCPVLTSKDDKAVVHPSCTRDINDNCRLICDDGYKSSVSRITCLPGSRWNITDDTSCKEILCKDYFDGGSIEPACTRRLRVSCDYNCDTGLQPNPSLGGRNLTCMDNGMWSHGGPEKAAICTVVPVAAASTTNGAAIGVGVGAAFIIILILILVFFLYRSGRLFGSKNPETAPGTSFENPRYTGDGMRIEGAQNERSLAYAKLDEETVDLPKTEHVYDNPSTVN